MRHRYVFWFGLLLYVASFFLVAIKVTSPGGTIRGFECARVTLFSPWAPDATSDGYFVLLSVLLSGWINPVFLITAIFVFFGKSPRLIAVMRIVVVLMIPFCWVVFHYYEGVYPREGHFVWIVGMLMTLFSREPATGKFA